MAANGPRTSQSVLLMKEYGTVAIGPHWDPKQPQVSRREVALLERIQSRYAQELLELGYRHIKATNWVGSIGLGDKVIEVLPKLDSPQKPIKDATTRANLLHMLAASGCIRLTETDLAALISTGSPLLVALMAIYVRHVAREWRRGAIRRYVAQEENRRFLKGKLLIRQHVRRNAVERGRFLTTADEFTEDNEISRFLKAALAACSRQRLDRLIAQDARELLRDFDAVRDLDVEGSQVRAPTIDRTLLRFEPVVALAGHILAHSSPERDAAGNACYVFMFDMNEIYERFVAAEMSRALAGTAFSASPQISGRSLFSRSGKPAFALRPDIGVYRGGELVCVLDTKWKLLQPDKHNSNVSQADMYQMYAYGKEYAVPRTVLLFPRHGALSAIVDTYDYVAVERKQVVVATVDVAQPLGMPAARNALRGLLRGLATSIEEAA